MNPPDLNATRTNEVVFTRQQSVADLIERQIEAATRALDAALYRFNIQRLAHALDQARKRAIRVRLVLDRNKYDESRATAELLQNSGFNFRLTYGRKGRSSKMHHKFAIIDGETVLTGSYNWTLGSEEQNYENLVILREPAQVELYVREFEALWTNAEEIK